MEKIINLYQKRSNRPFEIIADSTGNLTDELLRAYHIHNADGISADTHLPDHRSILYIGNTNSAVFKKIADCFPDRRILTINAPAGTSGREFLILKLSRLRAAGATMEEAAAYFERHKPDSALFCDISRITRPIWSPEQILSFDCRSRA